MIEINNQAHAQLIARKSNSVLNPGVDQCVSRSEGGVLMGGAIYQDYTGRSLAMHVAAFHPRWLCRDLLWVGFHYAFVQLGCTKIFGQVEAANRVALEFDLRLGFKEEARIRDVYPSGDMVLLAMYREDCRWLNYTPKGIQAGGRT